MTKEETVNKKLLRRKLFAMLGVATCVIGPAQGSYPVHLSASSIKWGDTFGFYNPVDSEAPGCTMAFNYLETSEYDDGIIKTDWCTGAPCNVWRDGMKIAEVAGVGDLWCMG